MTNAYTTENHFTLGNYNTNNTTQASYRRDITKTKETVTFTPSAL